MSNAPSNNSKWKLAWKSGENLPHSAYEKTYILELPVGWMIKHIFFRNIDFAHSSLLYMPDKEKTWVSKNMQIEWEKVSRTKNPNFVSDTKRFKTPEGWVVKEFFTTKKPRQKKGLANLNLIYIEDLFHEWKI